MRRIGTAVLLLALAPCALAAQPVTSTKPGDSWEAFRRVEYLGGDGALKTKKLGALVLTDSSVGFYECFNGCYDTDKPPFKGQPLLFIRLREITGVTASSQVRKPIGTLLPDETEESVQISYETTINAEAPVFKTPKAQSGQLIAKINFRRKKLGIKVDSLQP